LANLGSERDIRAIFAGGWALSQLWLFWLAPIIGGAIGGALYASLFEAEAEKAELGAQAA
jgi:aquaporin Z